MKNIEIYTSPLCGFCHAAKRLLDSKGVDYTEYNILTDPKLKPEMIERANGARTVPHIFIDGIGIGGCAELYARESPGTPDCAYGTA